MTIKEAAEASGLAIDTIRFYEKSGMLPPVPRAGRGWRQFPPPLVEWLRNLARLRATGMPLVEMKRFAVLVHAPSTSETVRERLAILHAHDDRLAQKRAELDAAQAYLNLKIAVYSKEQNP
jgi:MerR family transcriptional regulator, aldehyde-responsive regulator